VKDNAPKGCEGLGTSVPLSSQKQPDARESQNSGKIVKQVLNQIRKLRTAFRMSAFLTTFTFFLVLTTGVQVNLFQGL